MLLQAAIDALILIGFAWGLYRLLSRMWPDPAPKTKLDELREKLAELRAKERELKVAKDIAAIRFAIIELEAEIAKHEGEKNG